jgi:hypothetical protein
MLLGAIQAIVAVGIDGEVTCPVALTHLQLIFYITGLAGLNQLMKPDL